MAKPALHLRGPLCELIAIEWLVRQGYQVFTPACGGNLINLIAYDRKADAFMKIDVKMRSHHNRDPTKYYHERLKAEQIRLGVRILTVDLHTRDCGFED